MDQFELLSQSGRATVEFMLERDLMSLNSNGAEFCSEVVMKLCEDPSLVLVVCDLCSAVN